MNPVKHDEHDPDSDDLDDLIDNLNMGVALRVNAVLSAISGEHISLEWMLSGTGNEPDCVKQQRTTGPLPVGVPVNALTDQASRH